MPNGKINGKKDSILDVLRSDPDATIPDIANLTGGSQSTVLRRLREYWGVGSSVVKGRLIVARMQ